MHLRNRQLPNPIFSSGGGVSMPMTSYGINVNSERPILENIHVGHPSVSISVENEVSSANPNPYSYADVNNTSTSSLGPHNSLYTPTFSNTWSRGYVQDACSNYISEAPIGSQGGTFTYYSSQPLTRPMTTMTRQVTDMTTHAVPSRFSMSDTELYKPSQSSTSSIKESEEIIRLKQRITELENEKQTTWSKTQHLDKQTARCTYDNRYNRDVNTYGPYYLNNSSTPYQAEQRQLTMNMQEPYRMQQGSDYAVRSRTVSTTNSETYKSRLPFLMEKGIGGL